MGGGAGVGDPHKLYGGSVHHEHRGVVGARFVGQNRLWFLTFKSCAAGPRIMSISGCGCPGPHGGWVGGWVGVGGWVWVAGWVAGWVGGWVGGWMGGLNPHSAHHARSSGTGRGWVGWVGFACTGWQLPGWLAGLGGWLGGWAVWLCGWLGGLLGGWMTCARNFSEQKTLC